ncbi:MAG: hypothetical protein H7329_02800 [Opitutaceae bacterium]|nr:hypothetical protein [Cytophagales bacterium]
MAYAQGNQKVSHYLQSKGFATNRIAGQFEFFAKHTSGTHYLIKPPDKDNATRGDLLFLQNPSNTGQNTGHVAIVSSTRILNLKNGGFSLFVYTTNAGVTSDPAKESNTFGEAVYTFEKLKDGNYRLANKLVNNMDNNTWKSKDMTSENLYLQGFGRVDEKQIVKPKKSTERKTSKTEE